MSRKAEYNRKKMIQRIQSLYLLVVAALMAVTLFAPLAWFGVDGEQLTLHAFSLESTTGEAVRTPVWTGLLLLVSCVLPLVILFLYKRRMVQLRLCVVELVLLVGCLAMLAFAYFWGHAEVPRQGMKPAIALPLVCLVFTALAARAIFRDELLVRSVNRIR